MIEPRTPFQENQDFVKTGQFDRSWHWHPSPAYRSLIQCEEVDARKRKRDAVADETTGDSRSTTKRCRLQLLSGVDIMDATVQNITASEALGLVQDFARGKFLGSFTVDSSGFNDLHVSEVSFSSSSFPINRKGVDRELHSIKSVPALRSHFIAKVLNRVSVTLKKESISSGMPVVEEKISSTERYQERDVAEGCLQTSCGDICSVTRATALDFIGAAGAKGLSVSDLLIELNICEQGDYTCMRCVIKIIMEAASAGRIFLFERMASMSGDGHTSMKFSSCQFWENILCAPRGVRNDFFSTTIVVNSKYKELYYHCSVDEEGACPWVHSDGSRNIELFCDLVSCILAFLAIKPGSSVSAIHSSVPILTSVQGNILVNLLESTGVIQRKFIPLYRALDGPFGRTFRPQLSVSVYYVA